MTAGYQAGRPRLAPGPAPAQGAGATATPWVSRLQDLLRERGGEALAATVLVASFAVVMLAGAWTGVVARYPESQPSVAQLEADLAAEQARADDLQVQLDSILAASSALAGGMDQIGERLGGDATSAQSLRAALAEARARLDALRRALLAAGVAVPTRAPSAAGGNGAPAGGAAGAAILPTAAPIVAPAPTAAPSPAPTSAGAAYPPGVPASWPSSKPIPPMPSPCVQPQLEDNGVWNCQH